MGLSRNFTSNGVELWLGWMKTKEAYEISTLTSIWCYQGNGGELCLSILKPAQVKYAMTAGSMIQRKI